MYALTFHLECFIKMKSRENSADRFDGRLVVKPRVWLAKAPDPPIRELQMKNILKDSKITKYLVDRIVDEIHPLRIVLFGSAARGETGVDSDIDLLVVMPEGVHRRRTAQALYRNIRNVGVPFDILVATPTDLEKHKNNAGLIYRTILSEGKELYAS